MVSYHLYNTRWSSVAPPRRATFVTIGGPGDRCISFLCVCDPSLLPSGYLIYIPIILPLFLFIFIFPFHNLAEETRTYPET
ncbi:hypothetical protein BDV12DRAFT_134533 [Aspergillus spectabilis]